MMGVYPPGSTVQLTDDRYALVVSVNSSRPLKPRVLVHEPKVPRDEALILDLERTEGLGIRRSLQPAATAADHAGLPVAAPARGLLLRTGARERFRAMSFRPEWHTLIEAMPHAVWLVDAATLRVVAANGPAAQLLGCERATAGRQRGADAGRHARGPVLLGRGGRRRTASCSLSETLRAPLRRHGACR